MTDIAYRDTDGFGRVYEVHRRSIHPAMRVCREWGSLLLNDKTMVVCEEQACTDWLSSFLTKTGFMAMAQETVVRSFGLGTGAWALWVDAGNRRVRIRSYDARMVIPLTWDEGGVTECAFVTKAFYRGKAVDQLQMHLRGGSRVREGFECGSSADASTYRIITRCFDEHGVEVEPAGVCPEYDTGCAMPTFAIVKPAVDNTVVDMSPYGQSIFADAVDVLQAVDLAFDALINEVDVSKMRIFLSDVMFERDPDGRRGAAIPFGKQDCTANNWVPMGTGSTDEAFKIAREVGCIHTVQGYDLSYAYVIIGEDIRLDAATGRLAAVRANYFDRNGKASASDEELTEYIKNIYYVLLTRGIYGTHVYAVDPGLRAWLRGYFAQEV